VGVDPLGKNQLYDTFLEATFFSLLRLLLTIALQPTYDGIFKWLPMRVDRIYDSFLTLARSSYSRVLRASSFMYIVVPLQI